MEDTLKKIKLRDIKAGEFNYGERIQMENIFRAEMGEFERIKEVILCLHDIEIRPEDAIGLAPYANRIMEDMAYWIKREQQELHIPPTSEETEAGIDELSKVCGEVGNLVSLSEKFCCPFEDIYKRPYTEIFAILKVGVERTKYERRLQNVYARKNK